MTTSLPTNEPTRRWRPKWTDRISSSRSNFPNPSDPIDRTDSSRVQVMAAATRRLCDEPLSVLSQGLNPTRFDNWLPGLRRKAYRVFPASTELVKEVLMLATGPGRGETTEDLTTVMATLAADADGPIEAVHGLCGAYMERIRADKVFQLELSAWTAMDDHPPLRAQMNELRDALINRGAEGLEAVLTGYGLKLRSPLTYQDLATVFLRVIQGTQLAAGVRDDEYDPDILAHTVMCILIGATERTDDESEDLNTVYVNRLAPSQMPE